MFRSSFCERRILLKRSSSLTEWGPEAPVQED